MNSRDLANKIAAEYLLNAAPISAREFVTGVAMSQADLIARAKQLRPAVRAAFDAWYDALRPLMHEPPRPAKRRRKHNGRWHKRGR